MSLIRAQGRGQSGTIGVVLMVAVVVVLSGAIGTFVVGLPGKVSSTPQAGFEIEQSGIAGGGESDATVRVTHISGDTIDASNLRVQIEGTPVEDAAGVEADGFEGKVSSGDSVTINQTGSIGLIGGETVRVIYVADDEGEAVVLARHEVEGEGYESVDIGAVLSFEDGSDGDTSPPSPWFVVDGDGTMNISDNRPSDGNVSLYIEGSGGGQNDGGKSDQNVGVRVDLTNVATIKADAYIAQNDNSQGEIQAIFKNDTGYYQSPRMGWTQKSTGWHNDSQVDVTSLDGEYVFMFHADGANNRGYFDNVRFYDASGNRIPAYKVVISG